jgi:hypothetical protein
VRVRANVATVFDQVVCFVQVQCRIWTTALVERRARLTQVLADVVESLRLGTDVQLGISEPFASPRHGYGTQWQAARLPSRFAFAATFG